MTRFTSSRGGSGFLGRRNYCHTLDPSSAKVHHAAMTQSSAKLMRMCEELGWSANAYVLLPLPQHGLYVIDQARRGNAGHRRTIECALNWQHRFNRFNVGFWPNYFDGIQFARDRQTCNRLRRQHPCPGRRLARSWRLKSHPIRRWPGIGAIDAAKYAGNVTSLDLT